MTRVFVSEILCGGGWVEPARATGWAPALFGEAWAMLSAITADFADVPDVQVVTLLDERLPNYSLDPRIQATRVDSTSEPLAFRELAANADYALVIAPEIDGILHQRSTWAQGAGAKLLGPSPDAVALTSDKLALARHWLAAGVPTPMTVSRTAEPPPFPPPWIVKPRFGAGSQGIALLPSHSASGGDGPGVRGDPDFVIQPLIPGRAASVAFLIGPKQTIALPPCWQHLNDHFHYLGGSTPIPEPLAFRARSIATAAISSVPGLFGYVGVDVLLGEQDMAIEINPRLTTSYVGLRQLSKTNLAEAMLRVAQGQSANLRWSDSPVNWICSEPEA